MKTKKRSITKQEKLVSALYTFAHNQQNKKHDCTGTNPQGRITSVNLESVGIALDEIMEIFGYTTTPIH